MRLYFVFYYPYHYIRHLCGTPPWAFLTPKFGYLPEAGCLKCKSVLVHPKFVRGEGILRCSGDHPVSYNVDQRFEFITESEEYTCFSHHYQAVDILFPELKVGKTKLVKIHSILQRDIVRELNYTRSETVA